MLIHFQENGFQFFSLAILWRSPLFPPCIYCTDDLDVFQPCPLLWPKSEVKAPPFETRPTWTSIRTDSRSQSSGRPNCLGLPIDPQTCICITRCFEWSPPTGMLSWHCIWHTIWHLFWHYLWHVFRHSIWQICWHVFWLSIWHTSWHIWHELYLFSHFNWYIWWHLFDVLSDILSDICLNRLSDMLFDMMCQYLQTV